MSHLATAAVNVSSLREYARKELLEILDKTPGKKALVLDQKLSGPLSLIAEYSLLKVFNFILYSFYFIILLFFCF